MDYELSSFVAGENNQQLFPTTFSVSVSGFRHGFTFVD
jgi:hypothetical protein